jgi:RHS repeat-associated protein
VAEDLRFFGRRKGKRGQATFCLYHSALYFKIEKVACPLFFHSHTNPKGNTTSLTRDGMGRITQVMYHDGSIKAYTYDCCVLTNVTDPNGTIVFVYDTLKRLQSLTDVYGKSISYAYDKNSNLITLTYPDGKVVGYEYDKANRLIKVTDWLNNITTYQYDTIGNLNNIIYPNGSTINYQYDNANRLKTIIDFKSDGSLNALYKYTLDQLGNRTLASFYQPLNSIPTQLNTSYTYDVDNRMLTAGAETFDYDNNGNLITKTVGGNVTNYSWDFNDMLTQVTNGSNTYIYRYDGLGSRVASIENGVEKRYVSGLVETDASGSITAYYVYGLGLISKITPSNEVYYYHYDGIGSTIGISDPLGNMVNKYAYDAFGKVLNQEEVISNPFKYVGQFGVMDEENGLLYMRARYYDPEVGRFISKDPIGILGGLNLYGYVQNNPVNGIDPEGRAAFLYHFIDGFRAGRAMGMGVGESLKLGLATMMPDFNYLKSTPEAHATRLDPGGSPGEAIDNALVFAARQWASGTTEGLATAIHTWRDVASHSGSYFPDNPGVLDWISHIVRYDLLPGGSFKNVIGSRMNSCK